MQPTPPRLSILIINKDDPGVALTLQALFTLPEVLAGEAEVLVVDASQGALDHLQADFPALRWVAFQPPAGGGSSIPEQRNCAARHARGEILVWIDASCVPSPGWLPTLTEPIRAGAEEIVAGSHRSARQGSLRDDTSVHLAGQAYLREAPTINLAVRRSVHEALGGFDESFGYGSDVDFTWRAVDAGYRIRYAPDAVVTHDWGDFRQELRRSRKYGEARARLYLKHPARWRGLIGEDAVLVIYSAYLLALPLSVLRRFRWLPLLILVPAVRNRRMHPVLTIVDHLTFAAGALGHFARRARRSRTAPVSSG